MRNEEPTPAPAWTPSAQETAASSMAKFRAWLGQTRGLELSGYDALWDWSVQDLPGFWSAVWEYFALGDPIDPARVLVDRKMPGTQWFPEAHVNLSAYILRPRADEDAVAVVGVGEIGPDHSLTWSQLREQVAALAANLRSYGVVPGDVVAGYLPNVVETIVAFLASVSVGAIWSAVGQEYAPQAAADRLAQLEPVVLFAADGHVFNGSPRDRRDAVGSLRALLPSLRRVVGISRLGDGLDDAVTWAEAISGSARFEPANTAFAHPLWVLFSSGTTGLPKGIVHSHGGVLLEYVKMAGLHLDLGPDDRFSWYTSPSWVVWNCLVGGMACAGSVLCFDGAPQPSGPGSLWDLVAKHGVTVFGTSPGFLAASQKAGARPATEHDLSALRLIGSTGAPLPDAAYDYAAREIGPIPVCSMSGGTDIAGAFAMGSPDVPVWPGEISVRGLGVALEAWNSQGTPVIEEVGELVVTAPMPSMPLRFWNDPDGARLRSAYFEYFPGVWRHGDWITLSNRGTLRVHGRSDSTLNRNGVRMGSADIYAAVEAMEEIVEALVVGVEEIDGGYWMPLFVVIQPGAALDQTMIESIKARVREQASPRHVPDVVIAVDGIPHTRTGKKLEVPVKRLIQGAAYQDVVDPNVVDDPAVMQIYVDLAAERLAVVHAGMQKQALVSAAATSPPSDELQDRQQ